MQAFEYLLTAAQQVLILFLMIAAGAVLSRLRLLDGDGAKQLANLLFYVATPAVIVKAFMGVPFSKGSLLELLSAALIACGSTFLSILISTLVFRRAEQRRRAVLISATVFSNCGFMSLPLAGALLGDEGVFIVSVHVVVFNLLVWTYGIWVFERGAKISPLKAVLTPGMIGIILGLPLFLTGVELPMVADTVVSGFAALNTPLAMIVIGSYVAGASFRPQKGDGEVAVSILLRQFGLPLAALGILILLKIPQGLLMACMIPICAPAAANTVIFAAKFDGDVEFASRIMPLGTLLSILTMPVVLTLANMLSAS